MPRLDVAGEREPPAEALERLRAGVVAGALPLMRESLEAALRELDQAGAARPPSATMIEDRADLALLLRDVLQYEQRWQQNIDLALKDWPVLPRAGSGEFELLEDSQLQTQLIGASVIDALERRFEDAVDLLDQRLYTLAAAFGVNERPRNPFAPRSLAECFLNSFTTLDGSIRVHALVLKHFSRLSSDRLAPLYRWCNGMLADAGYELSSASEGVLVLGRSQERIHWRRPEETERQGAAPVDAIRSRLMRLHRAATGAPAHDSRQLTPEEMLAVLTLLQVETAPSITLRADAGTAERLRLRIREAGAGIGIDRDRVVPTPLQDASIEVVGRLVDALADDALLSDTAAALLERLAVPLLRAAMEDRMLFDDRASPILLLLAWMVRNWDGNGRHDADQREEHRLVDDAAMELLDDQQGDMRLPARLLEGIAAREQPSRRRAEMAAKRAWQSVLGKERLELARQASDARLQELLARGPLPPVLADFLAGHWRQWLVQICLRDGADSARYAGALGLGDGLVDIDRESDGRRVAEALLQLEPQLRDSVAASGLQGDAATAVLSTLVAEFADPDRARTAHAFAALATEPVPIDEGGDEEAVEGVEPGDAFVLFGDDATPQRLRLAWRSPLSGRYLLVDRHGAPAALLAGRQLAALLAEGRCLHRRGEDPVRAALHTLEAALPATSAAR